MVKIKHRSHRCQVNALHLYYSSGPECLEKFLLELWFVRSLLFFIKYWFNHVIYHGLHRIFVISFSNCSLLELFVFPLSLSLSSLWLLGPPMAVLKTFYWFWSHSCCTSPGGAQRTIMRWMASNCSQLNAVCYLLATGLLVFPLDDLFFFLQICVHAHCYILYFRSWKFLLYSIYV